MTKETRERIFEPFFTSKPKGRGTGLGLAMLFAVVSQSGGAIDVYSEVDHGTIFKIDLPRVEQPAETFARISAIAELPRGNESILLVEDEVSVREMARSFLQRQGYQVVGFSTAGEALAYAEGRVEAIDLLFTDIVLPGMNGRELAERLCRVHPETAVLFASGYTEDTILHTGVMADQFHFISKPHSLHAIAHKVREVLAGHKRD